MAKNTSKKKQRKTHDLRLTKFELIHLRDLFSVVLPPDLTKTLSQALCESDDRQSDEASLWAKIAELCLKSNVSVGDDAPTYIVAPSGPQPLSVFQLDENEENHNDSAPTDGIKLCI